MIVTTAALEQTDGSVAAIQRLRALRPPPQTNIQQLYKFARGKVGEGSCPRTQTTMTQLAGQGSNRRPYKHRLTHRPALPPEPRSPLSHTCHAAAIKLSLMRISVFDIKIVMNTKKMLLLNYLWGVGNCQVCRS